MWPSKALHGLASAQTSTNPLCHSFSVLLQIPGICWALFVSQASQALTCLAPFTFAIVSAWTVCSQLLAGLSAYL